MTSVVRFESAALSRGEKALFSDLDLAVAPGEILAVVGANGTGKTSLLNVILGQLNLDAGSVEVDGQDPARARHSIGYVPQNDSFDRDVPLRGRDLVALGVAGSRWGLRKGAQKADVEAALHSVGAEDFADHRLGKLSGGQRQRLRIAHALVSKPRLLLVDEPFNSLDVESQERVAEVFATQVQATQCACIIVTHDIEPLAGHINSILHLTAHGHDIHEPTDAPPVVGGH